MHGELGVLDDMGIAPPVAHPIPLEIMSLGSDVASASAGEGFSIFLMKNGTVYSAGSNYDGELGRTTANGRSNPLGQVTSLGAEVASVAAGQVHSIFLMKNGTVYSAGSNKYGQLGVTTNAGSGSPNPTPLEVTALGANVAFVAAGGEFSIFVMKNGTVYTAGSNKYGQLGVTNNVGSDSPNPTPLEVTALGNDVASAAGGGMKFAAHALFLMKNGTVFSVGRNSFGQLGVTDNMGNSTPNPTPLEVASLGTDVKHVSCGDHHSIFVMKNGTVYTAGHNSFGQLADRNVTSNVGSSDPNTPVEVTALGTNVASAAAGPYHSLFLMRNGTVYSAGCNYYGQLGVPDNAGTSNVNPTPLEVRNVSQVSSVHSSYSYQLGGHSIFVKTA